MSDGPTAAPAIWPMPGHRTMEQIWDAEAFLKMMRAEDDYERLMRGREMLKEDQR